MPIDTSKYTNHTREEIEDYLKAVKKSVNNDRFLAVPEATGARNL